MHTHTKSRFEPEVYYNDTFGLATSTQPTVYQRIPQVFNLAVNSWMRTFVGERGVCRVSRGGVLAACQGRVFKVAVNSWMRTFGGQRRRG